MSDLSDLADYCHAKAADDQQPPAERTLWGQIATEIGDYLTPETADAGLFEATP